MVVAKGRPRPRKCIELGFGQPTHSRTPVLRPNEETILGRSATLSSTQRSRSRGFSMVELSVSLTVVLILTAMAIPSLMRSFRTYQLNDAAARVSDMLKFTRFEAVRRNKQVCFLMQQSPSTSIIGTDSTCGGTFDVNGKQEVIAGFATLLSSGVAPSPSAISTALGGASLTTKSGSNGSVTFDARGAIRVGGNVSSSVFVFYIGSATDPEFGYRAVVLIPSGSTQIWTVPSGGTWQQIS
jgi:type IV fimbrial biogenesis protein FimT